MEECPMLRYPVRLVVFMLACTTCAAALAQDYPNRAVKIIVPFAAGGPADIYARFLGQRSQEAMGQPFSIDSPPATRSPLAPAPPATTTPHPYTPLPMS